MIEIYLITHRIDIPLTKLLQIYINVNQLLISNKRSKYMILKADIHTVYKKLFEGNEYATFYMLDSFK